MFWQNIHEGIINRIGFGPQGLRREIGIAFNRGVVFKLHLIDERGIYSTFRERSREENTEKEFIQEGAAHDYGTGLI
jgi:hypothetical protein